MSIDAALRTATVELYAAPTQRRTRFFLGYYLLLWMLTFLGVLYGWYFSDLFFSDMVAPSWLLVALKLSWLVPLPYALLNFYSFIRYPIFLRAEPLPVSYVTRGRLIFRYVSRGNNPHLVRDVVMSAYQSLLAEMPHDSWRLEVVVDVPQPLTEDPYLRVIVVPSDYETENGARYKARALHYALSVSTAAPSRPPTSGTRSSRSRSRASRRAARRRRPIASSARSSSGSTGQASCAGWSPTAAWRFPAPRRRSRAGPTPPTGPRRPMGPMPPTRPTGPMRPTRAAHPTQPTMTAHPRRSARLTARRPGRGSGPTGLSRARGRAPARRRPVRRSRPAASRVRSTPRPTRWRRSSP